MWKYILSSFVSLLSVQNASLPQEVLAVAQLLPLVLGSRPVLRSWYLRWEAKNGVVMMFSYIIILPHPSNTAGARSLLTPKPASLCQNWGSVKGRRLFFIFQKKLRSRRFIRYVCLSLSLKIYNDTDRHITWTQSKVRRHEQPCLTKCRSRSDSTLILWRLKALLSFTSLLIILLVLAWRYPTPY